MIKQVKQISLFLAICMIVSAFAGIAPASAAEQSRQIEETQESFTLPDIVGKEEAEEHGYVGRVKAAEADLYTMVFRNEDGTNTMRVYSHPVKYIDESGTIRDISLDVAAGADGSFVTASHEIRTTFRKKLADGITLAYDDIEVTMLPKTASGGDPLASVSSDRKLVSYTLDERTSYEYSLTYTGFKEDIVVSEYTGQTEYEFLLYTGGLAVSEKLESYYLVDGNGNTKAAIGDIIVFTADERNNTIGGLSCETVEENEVYLLTIRLDDDYLADERTAYPIRIDPSIEVSYSKSGAKAIEDVTINSLRGSDGSSGSIYVGKRDTYGVSRTLMKFPGLDLSSIADASSITKATVEIRDILCEDEALMVYCYVFTGNTWTESTASWSTVSPDSYSTLLDSQTVSYANGVKQSSAHRYGFEITSAVKTWKTNSTAQSKGIIFKASNSVESGSSTIRKTFSSYNRSSNQPSLTVEYTELLEDGIYILRNAASRKSMCLDSNDLFKTTKPYQYTYSITALNQYWRITYSGNGQYMIRPYLNYSKMLAYSTTSGVYLTESLPVSSAMKWTITPEANYYSIRNVSDPKSLASEAGAANYSPITMETYNSGTSSASTTQRWMFVKVTSPPSGIAWQASNSDKSNYSNVSADNTIDISATIPISSSVTYSVLHYSMESPTIQQFVWSSDNSDVAVSNGTITVSGRESAVITATHRLSRESLNINVTVDLIYGNQDYRNVTSKSINCHGYAMKRNDWPGGWWINGLDYINDILNKLDSGELGYTSTLNETIRKTLASKTKIDFEKWLDDNGYVFEYESSFTGNGEYRPLAKNQYRVALRTGFQFVNIYNYGRDYHFWYQTYDGRWANKHGQSDSELLPFGTTPYTTGSSGWANGAYVDFYDSPIYVYIITIN